MKQVILYTDGACSGNPGVGGWGAVLMYNGHEKQISGAEDNTTNNRMELTAVIEGLKCLKEPCSVQVYSDSAYTVNAFAMRWIYSWRSAGWIKPDKKPVLNADLWQELLLLTEVHNVAFNKVKGHADNEYNNLCDKLAT
ncbi:MAG: ribonuclease HI, partial [Clostridia bacterium]|nr:ribonuclease HI [Clostridia bacterium]